jgi:hypothetical protein
VNTSSISWQIVVLVLAVLGGSTFLGYEHVLTGDVVAGVYTAVLSGALVGHFTAKAGSGST